MRPVGEVRQVLLCAAQELNRDRDGVTWRELAQKANVGYLAARRTAENMERAGVLEVVGHDKRAGSRKWMKLYKPGSQWATQTTQDLASVMSNWVA